MKAEDNPFPSVLFDEVTEPAAPAAGEQRLYIDSTSHRLKRTDSAGADVDIENAATDAHIADAAGAHAASAIAFTPAGTIAATTVQAAIEEVASEAGGGGGGGGLLAAAYYNPSGGVVTKTFTGTLTALDTTNLRATFDAPASGNVIVRVGGGRLNPNNANPHFGVKEGGTTLVTKVLAAANASLREGPEVSFFVTGLTPGNSYSFDFAVANTNLVSASTLQYGYSTSNMDDATGPAHIEVWEAP